jgi:hypothetical protein
MERVDLADRDATTFRVGAVRAAAPAVATQRPAAGAAKATPVKSRPIVAPKPAPALALKRPAARANGSSPVARLQATIATAVDTDDDWTEF